MSFQLAELERRMANMIRVATIVEVNAANKEAKVLVGDLITAWLPMPTAKSKGDANDSATLEVGQQVVVLSPFGDLAQGVIGFALYSSDAPSKTTSADISRKTFKDGAVIEYDRVSHALKAVLPAGATTKLISSGGIKMVGDLTLEGDLLQTGNQTVSGDIDVSGAANVGMKVTVSGAVAAAGVTSSTSMTTPSIAVAGIDFAGHTHTYTDSDSGSTASKSTGGAQ